MECDSAQSLVAAVESGKGVALVLQTLSKVAGKRIALRTVTPTVPCIPIAVVYQKQRLSAAGQDFITTLKAQSGKYLRSRKPVLVV
jgi:DNA-binding transcriptional LysR family regulator